VLLKQKLEALLELEVVKTTAHRIRTTDREDLESELARRLLQLKRSDNLGFLVTYNQGRYLVGPAYRGSALSENELYYRAPDENTTVAKFLTVHRDVLGVQRDIEEFEALLNKPEVTEPELQTFFEHHPGMLDPSMQTIAMPHVRLENPRGRTDPLIPDFVLKPIVAPNRDINWKILDLKRPQAKLTVGEKRRRRLSSEVSDAVRRLRDYGEYFRNPSNSSTVESLIGCKPRYPRLAVLIGRIMETSDIDALNEEQDRNCRDVRIVTYDEILEQQQVLLGQQI